MSLKNKVAVVTGSGRGIGRAVALGFAAEGAKVVVNSLHRENVEPLLGEAARLGSEAVYAVADVSSQEGVDHLFKITKEKFGRVDVLVNNAGINIVKPALEMTESEWQRVISVNLTSIFLCSQAAARMMISGGSGRIINVASIVGINPFPNRGPYASSKAGVIMLTRELAIEWAQHNIRVNGIAPGFFLTDLLKEKIADGAIRSEAILKRVPMKRFGELDELVNLAKFLASEQSNYITGQTIAIDGGYTAYGFVE